MLQYQKNASPCVLGTLLNCMAVQSFSFSGILISAIATKNLKRMKKVDSQILDSPYYVFVALCIVVIVVSLIFKIAYFLS
jgi:hypothetical protein